MHCSPESVYLVGVWLFFSRTMYAAIIVLYCVQLSGKPFRGLFS